MHCQLTGNHLATVHLLNDDYDDNDDDDDNEKVFRNAIARTFCLIHFCIDQLEISAFSIINKIHV